MTDIAIALYQPDIAGNTGSILRTAACLGLAVHPRFDEHPEVLRMLARDASPDAVMDTLLSIDPESRERIGVDLRA